MEELALKVEHVSKEYRLGTIGGGTLKGEIQSRMAKIRHKEDPNLKIGAKEHSKNERFMALNDVSFEIKKGEKIGIIGHNGAGKSTILKLICRVTAPTNGNIFFNGRITSMLEVGTGFHAELTGRENIYLNGAILGMSKSEIDSKMEKIIEFSECGQFIDTPVKRYSSGMYVKLAFSVAAHLDSEILVMDEVLAVGDMAFQKKCIEKMNEISESDGRTILYVSHNMSTIRKLCDRCIVLNHGSVIFDGDVNEAINIYLNTKRMSEMYIDYSEYERERWLESDRIRVSWIEQISRDDSSQMIERTEPFKLRVCLEAKECIKKVIFLLELLDETDTAIGASSLYDIELKEGQNIFDITYDFSQLVKGTYRCNITVLTVQYTGENFLEDCVPGMLFEITDTKMAKGRINWNRAAIGSIMLPEATYSIRG